MTVYARLDKTGMRILCGASDTCGGEYGYVEEGPRLRIGRDSTVDLGGSVRIVRLAGAWAPDSSGVWGFVRPRVWEGVRRDFRRRQRIGSTEFAQDEDQTPQLPARAKCRRCGTEQVLDTAHLNAVGAKG